MEMITLVCGTFVLITSCHALKTIHWCGAEAGHQHQPQHMRPVWVSIMFISLCYLLTNQSFSLCGVWLLVSRSWLSWLVLELICCVGRINTDQTTAYIIAEQAHEPMQNHKQKWETSCLVVFPPPSLHHQPKSSQNVRDPRPQRWWRSQTSAWETNLQQTSITLFKKHGSTTQTFFFFFFFITNFHKCQPEPAAAALTYLVSEGKRLNTAWSRLDTSFAMKWVTATNTHHKTFSTSPALTCTASLIPVCFIRLWELESVCLFVWLWSNLHHDAAVRC